MTNDTDHRGQALPLITGMLDLVPDGYYAVQADDTDTVDFVRISRPTKGKFKDMLKIQTQHSERWVDRAAYHQPSKRWIYYPSEWLTSRLMLVVSDHRGCSRRYAVELQHCSVCNTQLTDDRSRHYLIGPVCDKKPAWAWVIEDVDDKNGGMSFEQLVARGLPTRVWQDR